MKDRAFRYHCEHDFAGIRHYTFRKQRLERLFRVETQQPRNERSSSTVTPLS